MFGFRGRAQEKAKANQRSDAKPLWTQRFFRAVAKFARARNGCQSPAHAETRCVQV